MSTEPFSYQQTAADRAIIKSMERVVETYDSYMRKVTLGREPALRKLTVETAGIAPGDSVLEIGCGTGSLTLAAKRAAGERSDVFGVDVIPRMIEISRQKAAQSQLELTFDLGSINALPFPDSKFAVVLCSFMIFHMSETVRDQGIAEIFRVLKPQGRLVVLDLALPQQRWQRAIARLFFKRMLTHEPAELIPLMERCGFSEIALSQAPFRVLGLNVLAFLQGRAVKDSC